MQITTNIGQPGKVADGSNNVAARGGNLGELVVQELHGKYYEQAYRKNTFYVATQAVVTTTVGLATTYTGLVLSNAPGNTVNLALVRATMMQSVIQSTQIEAFGLAYGFNATTAVTHTTPVTPKSTFIGAVNTPQALADVSATLPTAPLYGDFLTNTSSNTTMNGGVQLPIDGSIILPPGAYAAFVTPTQASVNGMWFGFVWEEIPV